METVYSDKKEYNFLRVYNLLTDPGETESRLIRDSWVAKAGLVQLDEHLASLRDHPPIPTGTVDPYHPRE